jgi:hypothetical protein
MRASRLVLIPLLLLGCSDDDGEDDRDAAGLADAAPHIDASADAAPRPDGGPPVVADGEDWWLPSWVEPTPGTGLFSEEASPAHGIDTRVADFTWRQLEPSDGAFSTTATGSAQDMDFASWDDQLAGEDQVWVRLWASGVDWAPEWVASDCGVESVGVDYDGQTHLPIWNACVWGHLMDLYREVFITRGLRADPRVRFVYVPGAFTWCEFDFDIINQAAESGLTFAEFDAWFQSGMQDLVDIMNGDNDDASDDYAWKLVYTGEDYPWGPWGADDDFLARDAVAKGMGVRTGITEVWNFHLNQVPAYGTTIAGDGHMVTDPTWVALDGKRVLATENECYNDCGYTTDEPAYAVKMSNLKALQLRMNWIYAVPGPSYMDEYAALWEYVRLEIGKTAATSPDAWVVLREAEDQYWEEDDSYTWSGAPWVKNWERWIVQRDLAPDGVSRRGTDVHAGDLDPENGTAYEGRRTDLAAGQDSLYLDVDDGFLHARTVDVLIKVTFVDGDGSWWIEYAAAGGARTTNTIVGEGSGTVRTATFLVGDATFDGTLGGADLRLRAQGSDLEARLVRVIKLDPP